MKTPLERERELSYKLLSEACAKKEGYDPLTARHMLSESVTALCPGITLYNWQVNLAKVLTQGLNATIITGAGSRKTLPWAMPRLLGWNHDRVYLMISPLNKLKADHVW